MDYGRFDTFERYEGYLRYMQLMDSMDMMESICENTIAESNHTSVSYTNPYKRSRIFTKRKRYLNASKSSDDDEICEDNIESVKEDSDSNSDDNLSASSSSKKKINLGNPYRGLKDSSNPLESMSDEEFLNNFKLSKKSIYDIMELIKDSLIKHTNRGSPVPPLMELITTLNYLTTGSIQKNLKNGISQATISRIITKVTKLLVDLKCLFMKFPNKNEIEERKLKFYQIGKFPEVVGCIGSTHVGIRVKGGKDGYVNESGFHSFRVQLITGPDLEIYDIDSKWPGSSHVNKIFSSCEVKLKFLQGEVEGVLLGNYAYNPTSVIMTSCEHPQSTGEFYYNEALSKTYSTDNCIAEWKKRFKCLQTFLACKPHTQQNIILSCAILHNIAKLNKDPLPLEDEQSCVIEIRGKREFPKRKIDVPQVEDIALITREDFIRKHFPVYYENPTISYVSL